MAKNVKLTEDDYRDAERLEDDIETILRLIDLIFLTKEDKKEIPS